MGAYSEAVSYLTEALGVAEQTNRNEDEAKIRHRLGLALWGNGDLEGAQSQVQYILEIRWPSFDRPLSRGSTLFENTCTLICILQV